MYYFPDCIDLSLCVFLYSSPSFLKTVILNYFSGSCSPLHNSGVSYMKIIVFLWGGIIFSWFFVVVVPRGLALLSTFEEAVPSASLYVCLWEKTPFPVSPAGDSEAFSDLSCGITCFTFPVSSWRGRSLRWRLFRSFALSRLAGCRQLPICFP